MMVIVDSRVGNFYNDLLLFAGSDETILNFVLASKPQKEFVEP